MNLFKLLKNKTIFICEDSYKKYLLQEMTNHHLLLDVKFFTQKEFFHEYLFTYDERACFELTNNYHFKIEIALMYLDNLYYLNNPFEHPKLNYLQELKSALDKQNLLIYNQEFKEYIKDYQIYVVGYPFCENYALNIFNDLNATIINETREYPLPHVYEFPNMEEEVNATFKEISKLISSKVDINHIKIMNVDDEYTSLLEKYASFYQIPLKTIAKINLYSTNIAHIFLNNLVSDLKDALNSIKDYDRDIVNKIISICNKYSSVKDISVLKKFLIYEFKKTAINNLDYQNYVDIINIEDYVSENDYVFLLNFNTTSIPKIIKDEDYLDDKLKEVVGIKTSIQKNKEYKEYTIAKLKSIKHLWLSYKLEGKYYPSILVNELHLNVEEYQDNKLLSYAFLVDKINYAKSLYNYETYGVNNALNLYENTFGDIKYNAFDNSFKGLDLEELKDYLNHELNLSYSSLNNYHKCPFRYYLTNILGIEKYEDTFESFIGSLFHDVLEKCLNDDIEVEDEVHSYLENSSRTLTPKEEFYIQKIIPDIIFVRDVIKEQLGFMSLDKKYLEKALTIDKSTNDMQINFKGFIDKILYTNINEQIYVAIIDYKTGNVSSDLQYLDYGLNMQLPIYLYLIKKSDLFLNPEVIGFYLQHILDNNLLKSKNKTLREIKKENLKLVGYSTSNIHNLTLLDKNYQNSELISGLKVNNDGSFSKASKILTKEEMDNIVDITEKIINNSLASILKGDFAIKPKRIGYDNLVGCEYCHFQDICYKKATDEELLKEISTPSFREGGEQDE